MTYQNVLVNILCTGGTFDKSYGCGAGIHNFSFPQTSAAKQIIEEFSVKDVEVDYDPSSAKDSLDMDEDDRQKIAKWCFNHKHCVVIHGTDTMIKTASVVASQCPDSVVVLTGALQPARMRSSDAEFNLGGAIIAARICPPGVYIVMNGEIFVWDKCQKNPTTGNFELV